MSKATTAGAGVAIAGGLALLLLLLKGGGGDKKAGDSGAVVPGIDPRLLTHDWSSEDVEYLARVLMMEAASRPDSPEWAGIAWVAVNRALDWSPHTIRGQVARIRWPGGGERGRAFVERIQGSYPTRQRTYPQALAFAERVLTGQVPSPVGRRKHFVHRRGMKDCINGTCGGTLLCVSGKCIPVWAVSKDLPGGRAEYQPVVVGRATFAGPPLDDSSAIPGVVAANTNGIWFEPEPELEPEPARAPMESWVTDAAPLPGELAGPTSPAAPSGWDTDDVPAAWVVDAIPAEWVVDVG